jgi:DUF438 domain-containing protein
MDMSREINNREYRKNELREMIASLSDGASVESVRGRFEAVFGSVSAEEIAEAEAALIAGGVPVEEVQRLCDVHASLFKGAIQSARADDPSDTPGHPINTLKSQNRAIEALIAEIRAMGASGGGLADALSRLWQIDLHYKVKENQLFPYLEKYGITAPPKVMWGVDDEIRAELKELRAQAAAPGAKVSAEALDALLTKIGEMVFKEENILFPMLLENLTVDEWRTIASGIPEIGYCLIEAPPLWAGDAADGAPAPADEIAEPGDIRLETGVLSLAQLTRMLDALPVDITFVDKDDIVRYFSQGAERVFPRTKDVIGRKVINCHPPASMHVVETLVDDFRNGRKDSEDFWIHMGDKLILIRYFAVRSAQGEYMGVVEVTQNIAPIQQIRGEKRLMS